ncbi:rhomboid-related protein 2-like [Zootermopsis nevadensis]|uniref:Rhomboid-related protein 3 n=1 Tax=Zootermopsis nevadensis TaxID=136037 RepID=A0A067QSR2_ZOONE|nr:rhomboid-related protein 2-like [Zootermopsis nevadensis]KDR11872.1 Rhomboid-related protein 3 [Zootermopsis nevadensis]
MPQSASTHEDQEENIPLQTISTRKPQQLTDVRELFQKYDVNRNGFISLCELRNLITSENYAQDLPEVAVHRILKRADADQNGYLDYKEFKQMMTSPDWQIDVQQAFQQYVDLLVPPRPRSHDEVDTGDKASIKWKYDAQYRYWPPPLGMIIISIIEVATFLTDLINAGTELADGPLATKLMYTPYRRFEAWRFFTYMFVHVGRVHLAVNLIIQILLGIPLEMVHQWWRVLIIYMAGVVAGSLGTSVTEPYIRLAGASGGVYAILMAHIATIILNWSEMKMAVLQLACLLVLIVTDVGSAIYYRYFTDREDSIGYAAHIAGALAGLLLGINVLRNLSVKSWEKKLWWASICIYVIIMSGAVIWNICYTDYYPQSDNF